MRNVIFNKIKLLIIAVVVVLAIALFKMNLNSNTLYFRTQELFNKMGWFQNREGIIGQLTVSSPSYYGENLTEPLEDNTNYVNKVKEVRFGLTTQGIENPEDVMYAIIYDNSNNDSPYTEDRYPDEIYDPQNPNGRKKVRLKYASTLDVKNADILDNQGIVNNDGKYSVLYRDNTIVVEDKGLIPYIGGNDSENAHKWVGILVDLNVKVQGTSGYNIDNVDYTDAARWGAKSDTTFVMWLNTEKGGTYTFTNVDDETNTFELNVQFTQQAISLKSATKVDNEFENKDKYSVEYVNNKITVIDDALTSYVKDGTEESQKWVGIQIDLGVASEIVGDNDVVIEEIENSNSFIMWVSKENAGTYTFKNVEYPDDTVDVRVEFTQRKIELKSATKISTTNFDENVDNPGILANADKYTVAYANNTITINDKGLTKYQLYEDENENKYVGILIDLGVKVQGVEESSYNEALHYGATNDTTFILWLTTSQGGVFTYKNDEYPTDKVNLNIEFTHDEIALNTFTPIDVTNADQNETNIVQNNGKYTSTINENTITIYDDGVIPYIGGNIETPAKWMGFIVDFGVKVQGTQNYNIEDIDYEAARRWGATTNTAFVMWVTPNKAGTVKFANVYYPEDEITLTLNFTHKELALTTFEPVSVANADQSESNIVQNAGKYTSTINENTITIYDDGVIPYVGGNIETPAKWMGFIVDFGVKVQGTQNYNIEDVDYEAARRWGATTDTAFVMWVTPNKAGTVKFANVYYPEDEITLTLDFTHKELALTTFEPINVTNADQNETNIVQNSGKYIVSIEDNTITINDNGVIPYVGGNIETPAKWMGFIVDFGVKVQGTQNYNIEDVDYEAARRWGATTDTAFVMWITPNKKGTITFANVDYPTDTININLNYTYIPAQLVEAKSVTSNGSNSNEVNNIGKYTVIQDKDTIKITDINIEPYVGGNIDTPKKWVGLIVDFGVDVQGVEYNGTKYTIEDIDRTYARSWGATTDTSFVMWLTTEKAGTYRFKNIYYEEDTIDLKVEFDKLVPKLITAKPIDVRNADQYDNPGIVDNAGDYNVSFNGNTITVEDKNLTAYTGLGDPDNAHKWMGLIVDFGVNVQGVEYNGTKYTIEDGDRTQARRWGAETDTAFVMWMHTGKTGTYRFKSLIDENDTIDVDFEFKDSTTRLVYANAIDGTKAVNGDNLGIVANDGRYNVTYSGNKITVEDVDMIPYVGGNINTPKKWVGLLVDLNTFVNSTSAYGIEEEDRTQAKRWGAESDTTFIMWLTTEKSGTYTFVNQNNPSDTISIEVEFVQHAMDFVSAESIDLSAADENNQTEASLKNNAGKYEVVFDKENNKVIVNEDNMIPHVGGNQNVPKNWVGLLLDFGVEVDCTSNYNIEDVDRTQARRWGAETDTAFIMWLTTDRTGSFTFVNKEYANDTYTIDIEFNHKELEFVSASSIDISQANINDPSEVNIKNNKGKYEVVFDKENNKVIVNENNMIPYVGGNQNVPKNWVGLLLDFGSEVVSTGTYNIEDVDRTYARRWGATTDTAFIMWLTTDKGGSYTFANKYYTNDTYTIDIEFNHKELEFVSASSIDISKANINDPSEVNIKNNEGKYEVVFDKENNKVIVNENNMIPYVGGNQNVPKNWVGLLLDFGSEVVSTGTYNIEDVDRTYARRWGATTDTAFIMWLTTDKGGSYTFANKYYTNDTYTIDIEFNHDELSLVSASTIDWTKATNNDNPGIVLNAGRYSVEYENNTITVDDVSMIPYKGGNLPDEDHKWIGILVDLGANVQGTELNGLTYNIDDIDRSEARRWGAETDTAFVMWIRTGDDRTYRFYNTSYPDETIDINVNFEHKMIDLESVQKIDISNTQNVNEDIELNINKYTVQRDSTDITIYDNNLVPYTRNEQFKKWTPVLVDLGVKVECTTGYEITQASYDEAQLYGATTETTFVMWLNTEDAGTYTFKNVYYQDDTFDLTFTFVEPELNCNANPYDERCPDLDQPLDNRIVLGENEQLITSQFDVEVDTINGIITLRLKDGVDYIPGNYKIYVWPSDNREGVKDQPFTLLDKYYNFDMAEDATIYSGTGTNIDDNNVWKVKLTNVENIDLTKITLESVTLTEDETQYDYTDNFEIVDRQVDANDPTVAYLYIGATLNVNDNIVSVGDYDLKFSYSNPEFSNVMGTLEKHTNITVMVPNQGFVDVSSSSHRLSSRSVYYEFVNYNRDTNMVTIKSGNDTLVLTATEFVSTYSGVDLDELTLDEDGSVLYPYNAGILIKSYSQVDGVNTIKYYDNENVLHTMPYTEFQQTYGNIDFNKYNYVDDAIYIKVNGKYREYEAMSRNIGYSDGGKFEFVVNYGEIDPSEFEHIKSLKLVHNADGVLSNEAFTIYNVSYTRFRIINSYYYIRHVGTVDSDAADSFDLITEVNRNNHTIKFTIVYDNNIARYIGEYKLTMELFNTSTVYEKTFTIEESSLDFYLASSVDKHESSVEPLLTNFPQGNKKYEYYLSLRMVKGTEDPYYQYSTDSLGVKIYSKLADKEPGENGAIYFYDQQDYVLKITNYKNNVVTYLYSEEVDKADSQRTYVERTETLDGNSDFEKLYTDAYNLLDKYVFNEDGSIDTTTDNYTKSIVYKKRENNTDYVKYRDGNNIIQLQANSYYATTNELDTLLTAFRYLDFDENGDVVVGSIIGSYKSHIYEYDEAYDVTDLFDISISSTNRDYPITILPKTEVNGGVYYTYVQYSSSLYGVGYLNNIIENGGSHATIGEVVIRPENYPSLWNRNIHMSTITYLDPIYSITLGEHQFTNTLNDTDELYSNAQSRIVYEVKPKDIFKYEDIVHKLQYKNESNQWVDVDTDKYSYYLATKNGQGTYDEIEDISNHSGKYYLVMTTSDTLDSGDYRLVVEYTNPNNNISLVNPVTADLQFTKFLGLSVNADSDELVVPHNDSVTKTIILDGENIADASNISVAIYYNQNGYGTPLNKQGNEYYYTVNNETHKYFDTSYEVVTDENDPTKIQYILHITNVSDVTQIGNYVIRFTYTEPNEVPVSRDVTYQITNDQFIVKLENVYPKVQSDEKSFTMDLTTKYIPSGKVNTDYIDISLLQFVDLEFVNVSDEGISNRQVSRIEMTDVTCENEVCTGKVTFYLNENINMEDLYNVKIRYDDVAETYAIEAFEDMFAWDLAEQKATSIYTYTEDNEELSREVDGIYKNLSDQKISIKVDTDIYKDKIKWSINDRCISNSGNTCTTADMYGDLFNEVNTTDVDQKLVLTPTRRNNSIQIPNGRYALVLYYSENDYKVVEFEVHSEYIHIDVDLTGEYGEATIKSTFNSSNGSVDVDGMYTNLDGVLTLPTVVTGADYSRLTRYVTDSMGNRVTKFTVNDSIDFVDTHTTKVIYESRNNVAAGDYILVTEYVIDENESIKFEYAFTVQSYYFDFNIMNDIQVYPDNNRPKYLYNNKAGKIVYTIQTQNLTDLDRGSNNGKMYEFMNNSKMLDADGNDVSNYFTFNVKAHNDIFISFKFDIEVSFTANVVPMGSYKLETFYTMSNKTVTKSSDWVTIDVSNRDFRIGEVEIDSPTEDHLVHTSHGGTYVINYTSNVENTKDKINVKVLLNDVDKTNNFTIEKTNTQVLVTVSENTNAIDGNYVVVITFEGDDFEVPVTLYDDYNPSLKLSSTVFDIVDNVIYIKNVSSNNFTLSGSTLVFNSTYFINNLSNLQEGFKVLNKNGENITHTVYRIGTGTKIYNPGDNITYTVILVGDVNQDGGLSLSDAARLFAHTTNKNPITDQKVLQAAKVRGKDAISLSDVAKLYNFIRGKITSL